MTSNYKTNVLLLQISCILFEIVLEIQWLWEETLSRWHNLLLFCVCSVAVRKAQNVPLTLGQFRVLVPVMRSSLLTSGNTESSVSCNSGEEVICVDLKTDKTFVQKYSQHHLQQLIWQEDWPCSWGVNLSEVRSECWEYYFPILADLVYLTSNLVLWQRYKFYILLDL